ncbi:hypothetical protein CCUS01_02126 [Colletotrichum cuscutae]|uniref:Uncharacterized protein n=1 Tax=Colletotrichum cuscutae TaxID=1209917 RepID=A0AAI9U2Z4_9PEZI|nr:hypothetical protein CCUS01_02126 [Colletotrichum cuscutae]
MPWTNEKQSASRKQRPVRFRRYTIQLDTTRSIDVEANVLRQREHYEERTKARTKQKAFQRNRNGFSVVSTVVFGGSITLPYIANSQLNLYIENKWTPSFGTELPRIYLQRFSSLESSSSMKIEVTDAFGLNGPNSNILLTPGPSTTVSEQNSMEIPRKILAHRQLDNTVSAVVRAVISLIVVLDGHVLTLSSTIRRVTTLMLCIDMITEFRNGFRKSKGGDRTRIDTQTGFYYASAIWIAVFDNDKSLWNFKIIQILVVLGDIVNHGTVSILFKLQDDKMSFSSLACLTSFLSLTVNLMFNPFHIPVMMMRLCIDCANSLLRNYISDVNNSFWGSIFAFASPRILQKICTADIRSPLGNGLRATNHSHTRPSTACNGKSLTSHNVGFKEPHILWPLGASILAIHRLFYDTIYMFFANVSLSIYANNILSGTYTKDDLFNTCIYPVPVQRHCSLLLIISFPSEICKLSSLVNPSPQSVHASLCRSRSFGAANLSGHNIDKASVITFPGLSPGCSNTSPQGSHTSRAVASSSPLIKWGPRALKIEASIGEAEESLQLPCRVQRIEHVLCLAIINLHALHFDEHNRAPGSGWAKPQLSINFFGLPHDLEN